MSIATNKYLIVIAGPTGIGKTEMALKVNERLNTSIISADSRQIYKELNIGTAKPSRTEITEGNIKLVDYVSIKDSFSAGRFEEEALFQIAKDHEQSNFSIVCGGTGLYIQAIEDGLDHFPEVSKEINDTISEDIKTHGLASIISELKEKDPAYYAECDLENQRRVQRALGVIRSSGKPFSSFRTQTKKERPFTIIPFVLDLPREELYQRINERVLKMIDKGLIDEVKGLLSYRSHRALETVGYSEVFKHLDGEWALETCIAEIQKNSRRYAKRQLTWLRKKYPNPRIAPDELDKVFSIIERLD